jgi:hypothetical protein
MFLPDPKKIPPVPIICMSKYPIQHQKYIYNTTTMVILLYSIYACIAVHDSFATKIRIIEQEIKLLIGINQISYWMDLCMIMMMVTIIVTTSPNNFYALNINIKLVYRYNTENMLQFDI